MDYNTSITQLWRFITGGDSLVDIVVPTYEWPVFQWYKYLTPVLFILEGFDAYCGFMHVEAAHTNPVAVTFLRILKSNVILAQETGDTNDEDGQRKHTKVGGQGNKHTFVKMKSESK